MAGSQEPLLPRVRREVADGAVHVPDWLDLAEQHRLVAACREWSTGPAGLRQTRLPSGGMMSVRSVCLGWHWYPYGYSRTVDAGTGDGPPVQAFPSWLGDVGRRAVAAAYDDDATGRDYEPDVALVNFYNDAAKMGMHRDKDECSAAPVVSLSLGDTCIFRFGNTENRHQPRTDLELRSGDLFVFGGESRLAFHGVQKLLPGTGDPDIGLAAGRLNITLRVSGLA